MCHVLAKPQFVKGFLKKSEKLPEPSTFAVVVRSSPQALRVPQRMHSAYTDKGKENTSAARYLLVGVFWLWVEVSNTAAHATADINPALRVHVFF